MLFVAQLNSRLLALPEPCDLLPSFSREAHGLDLRFRLAMRNATQHTSPDRHLDAQQEPPKKEKNHTSRRGKLERGGGERKVAGNHKQPW